MAGAERVHSRLCPIGAGSTGYSSAPRSTTRRSTRTNGSPTHHPVAGGGAPGPPRLMIRGGVLDFVEMCDGLCHRAGASANRRALNALATDRRGRAAGRGWCRRLCGDHLGEGLVEALVRRSIVSKVRVNSSKLRRF